MSGHSKWANIKRQKAVVDSKRAKEFTKVLREIKISARINGNDPAFNSGLRVLIEQAKKMNIPNLRIQRAISTDASAQNNLQEGLWGVIWPDSSCILIAAETDNVSRTQLELKAKLFEFDLVPQSGESVLWKFMKVGAITFSAENVDELELLEIPGLIEYQQLEDGDKILFINKSDLPEANSYISNEIKKQIIESKLVYYPNSEARLAAKDKQIDQDLLEAMLNSLSEISEFNYFITDNGQYWSE